MSKPTYMTLNTDIVGQKIEFVPDKIRSSKTYLVPEQGYFIKYKPGRSHDKSLWEFCSLMVWNTLLERYDLSLKAPHPYNLSERGCIVMDFMGGVVGKRIGNYKRHANIDGKKHKVHEEFIERVATLCVVKEANGLVHGDFDSRHVIYDIPTRYLSVIDVENSHIDEDKSIIENDKMEVVLTKNFKFHIDPEKTQKIFDDAYKQTLHSKIEEAIRTTEERLEILLDFEGKKVIFM